jgi:methionyl-tRNA formyltransferase
MTADDSRYIVAGANAWSRQVFEQKIKTYPGTWKFIDNAEHLTPELVDGFSPRYLFFLHWSWRVPAEIFRRFECVCFHMTDVPYGRGGSPLQNLIARGHRQTRLTALRMVEEMDAGPVYLKEELSLEGSAEEIYLRASYLSAAMIRRIIEEQPQPREQEGEPTRFKRREPSESMIPDLPSLQSLHDFIRMLDAENYPHAYFEHGGFRYEFTRAAIYAGRVMATVQITPTEKPNA